MVKRIKKTLADEGGATLLMALFALLLATTVCVVILGAATSSVKQEHAERAALQDEITLESAGTMLADNMTSKNTKCTYTVTTVSTKLDENTTKTDVTKDAVVSNNCLIMSLLQPQMKSLLSGGSETSFMGEFTIRAESGAVDPSGPGVSEGQAHDAYSSTVRVSYVLDSDCSITFTMDLMDGADLKETLYLKLKGRPGKTGTSYVGENTRVDTTSYYWTEPYLYRAGDVRS